MDANLKKQFTAILDSLGLDAPTAVRMLAKQTVKTKALPLSLDTKHTRYVPFEDEKAVLDWSEEMAADNWSEV
jgi:addiction module RelB/DinJ family antitoxin